MLIVYNPACLEYNEAGHPESPERVRNIYEALKNSGFEFTEAGPATEEDITLVHTPEHYARIREGRCVDADTPRIDIRYPLIAAGVTIKAAETNGFALTRPPGHHAGKDSCAGFCYFNNVAVAVARMGKRTAIIDLDVHHGNGTQDIFFGDSDVLYVSLHQSPSYPGTGTRSISNCQNLLVEIGATEHVYLKRLESALDIVDRFSPELLAVSMGFDTYMMDPLAGLNVTTSGYAKIGGMLRKTGLPMFVALEGGYSPDIGRLCKSFLNAI